MDKQKRILKITLTSSLFQTNLKTNHFTLYSFTFNRHKCKEIQGEMIEF